MSGKEQLQVDAPFPALESLSKDSSPSVHLDALRGLAAFCVLLSHWRDALFVDFPTIRQHNALDANGVSFVSLRDSLDLCTPSGRLMFQVVGAMAEFERAPTQERVRAGLQLAQTKACILPLPQIKTLPADGMFTADLNHRCAGLCLSQYSQNLIFRMTLLRHVLALLSAFRESRKTKISTYRRYSFRVLGHCATLALSLVQNIRHASAERGSR